MDGVHIEISGSPHMDYPMITKISVEMYPLPTVMEQEIAAKIREKIIEGLRELQLADPTAPIQDLMVGGTNGHH